MDNNKNPMSLPGVIDRIQKNLEMLELHFKGLLDIYSKETDEKIRKGKIKAMEDVLFCTDFVKKSLTIQKMSFNETESVSHYILN